MNKKQITITIPTPCNKRWDDMTPEEQGRFCAVCQKKVIDFTQFTDQQLLDFFKLDTDNSCGRYLSSQLNREIVPEKKRWHLFSQQLIKRIAASLLILQTIVMSAWGQTVNTGSIKGKITDSTNAPIIGAIVRISEGGIVKGGAVTDYNGQYNIKPISAGRYDVEADYAGMKKCNLTGILISADSTKTVNMTMKESDKVIEEPIFTGYKVPLIDKYAPVKADTAKQPKRKK